MILLAQGSREEAERVDRDVIAIAQRVLGPDAPLTLATTNNLGMVLRLRGLTPLHGNARFPALVAHGREVARANNTGR